MKKEGITTSEVTAVKQFEALTKETKEMMHQQLSQPLSASTQFTSFAANFLSIFDQYAQAVINLHGDISFEGSLKDPLASSIGD